jgi:hypothetical protein
MPNLMTSTQIINQKRECFYAKRLSYDLKTHEFAITLYQRLWEKIKALELSSQNRSTRSPIIRELGNVPKVFLKSSQS